MANSCMQLNLPRLKARDSCFTAPGNPGSSTGFRPTSRRPLSLTLHYGLGAYDGRSYNYTPSVLRESHFCSYTCNTVSCLNLSQKSLRMTSKILSRALLNRSSAILSPILPSSRFYKSHRQSLRAHLALTFGIGSWKIPPYL
jgi:hypothetical protein